MKNTPSTCRSSYKSALSKFFTTSTAEEKRTTYRAVLSRAKLEQQEVSRRAAEIRRLDLEHQPA